MQPREQTPVNPLPASSACAMPGLSELQRMLRTTTESLARELVQPSGEPPQWSEGEWITARAAAAIHGVAPLLSRGLRWKAPQDWLEHLREQAAHTAMRHERIEELLSEIDARARMDGVALVALK